MPARTRLELRLIAISTSPDREQTTPRPHQLQDIG